MERLYIIYPIRALYLYQDQKTYAIKQYENLIGKPVKTNVIHGGLETGMISTRISSLQMVSLGPTVEGLHSPSEKLKITDVGVIYQLLKNIVLNLKKLSD